MTPAPPDPSDLYRRLGYSRRSLVWAKVEILLGLAASGFGLILGCWSLGRSPVAGEIVLAAGGLILFVLGGYLTLAGHRTHLYQSGNERTAYLAEILRQAMDKGPPA
jgi:hypothetical protein